MREERLDVKVRLLEEEISFPPFKFAGLGL